MSEHTDSDIDEWSETERFDLNMLNRISSIINAEIMHSIVRNRSPMVLYIHKILIRCLRATTANIYKKIKIGVFFYNLVSLLLKSELFLRRHFTIRRTLTERSLHWRGHIRYGVLLAKGLFGKRILVLFKIAANNIRTSA